VNVVVVLESLLRPWSDVFFDRVRGAVLRLRGGAIGAKVRLGPHCSFVRASQVSLGFRCHFEQGVYVKVVNKSARVAVGDYVFVGRGTEFDISHRLLIGRDVLIAPGCFITDHSHNHRAGSTIASQGCESAPVTIGDDVWLGAHTVVLAGVTIGHGAIVAANSVVNADVSPLTIVAGSPARVVGTRH
jgi:carbonic anhydrase/acetyltransferase-like protein (isoleucine patch superfamily)